MLKAMYMPVKVVIHVRQSNDCVLPPNYDSAAAIIEDLGKEEEERKTMEVGSMRHRRLRWSTLWWWWWWSIKERAQVKVGT